jgi:hypothetical protein
VFFDAGDSLGVDGPDEASFAAIVVVVVVVVGVIIAPASEGVTGVGSSFVFLLGAAIASPCTTSDALRYRTRDARTVTEADDPASSSFTAMSPVSFIVADPAETVSTYVYVEE